MWSKCDAKVQTCPNLHHLVAVTRVVTPGAFPVFAPLPLTHPAELVLTLRARDVHAPHVLLDGSFALGAGLGVGDDPVHVFRLGAVLDEPLAHRLAVHGAVRVLPPKSSSLPFVHVRARRVQGGGFTLRGMPRIT